MFPSFHLPFLIAVRILDEECKLQFVHYMILFLFRALLRHYHFIVTFEVRCMDLETGPALDTWTPRAG
jgi:hypothetical protein